MALALLTLTLLLQITTSYPKDSTQAQRNLPFVASPAMTEDKVESENVTWKTLKLFLER